MVNVGILNSILSGFLGNLDSHLIILFEIGIIMIIATIFAFLIKIIKQPIIPGYIIAGIIVGPLCFGLIQNQELISALSEIGVAFLIFAAGLEIKFRKLKEVGRTTVFVGVLQVLLTFIITFFISLMLGIQNQSAIYIGLVVAFSSTMIVFKILSDRREINSLHGRIIIGILLIQDVIAIIALMVLSSDLSIMSLLIVFIKGILLAAMAVVLSRLINPILNISAKSHELLLLVSISFLFLFIIGSVLGGFSLIIGAFFAGISLANSNFKTEIEGKITPLREFFAVIFFVSLGIQLKIITMDFIYLFFVLFVLVVILKPLITMFLVRIFGYKKSTSFLTANALAQTSEFSLILATLGLSLNQISEGLFSTLVLLTILTMSLTIYAIKYQKKLSKWLDWPLNLMNWVGTRKDELEYHEDDGKKIVIIGCHRMGSLFVKEFEKNKKNLFVVDYNPDIISSLIQKKVPCIYGDFSNEEVFNKINIKKAEVVISTIPDLEDNLLLVKKIRKINKTAVVFIVADRISEALQLYASGADYVILPQVLGGQKVSGIMEKIIDNKNDLLKLKREHIKYLNSIHKLLY